MKRWFFLVSLIVLVSLLVSCAPAAPAEEPEAPAEATEAMAEETEAMAEETEAMAEETEAPAEEAGDKPDVVIIGMHQPLEFLNVIYTQGGNSLAASKLAQRGLLFLDADSNWIGELAEEVPSIENGGITNDGKTITFKLREGLTWHDGEEVTADDVKATWEMIMNPDNAPITRFGYNMIESVEVPDPYTVVMNYSEPFASWPILFDAILPQHVIEANSPGIDESEAMRQPIGFGPYKIKEWVTGDYIEYEAFDDYFRGSPKIDRLVIKIYPSVDALLQALEAKEVDIAWSMPIANVPQIQAMESKGISLITGKGAGTERYHMNPDAEIFQDRDLRVALHHAVDKQKIIDQLLFGLTSPANTSWDNSPWENTELEPYAYDVELCKSTLEGIGWVDEDGDGIREKDGERLSFTHRTTVGNLQRENLQLIVQQMFKECGAEMVIENLRSSELFGTWEQSGTWSRGDYEMGGWAHGLRVPDPEISNRFLCSEIASESNPAGSQWFRYCNPEVDELLLAQAQEFDPEKRKEMYFEIERKIHEDAYTIHIFKTVSVYGVNSDLKNFVLHPFASFYFNPQEWEW